jgi:PleD family two-component response regulator
MEALHVLAVGHDPGELEGISVETAEDLLGALARLSDGGVDLVLLALDLHDGEGVEAIRSVREIAPHVPVIAVDGDGQGERALQAGAADVVPPDVEPELVARAVRYAVALHRMRDELRRREIVDPETGLYNARGFETFAAHHVALADRTRQPLVLLSIGVGGLEDEEGEAGRPEERSDELVETAAVLRTAVRDCDVLARTGAMSFHALLTGDAVGAESLVLSRMVDAIAVRNARSGHRRPLALSVGAARYDPDRPVSLKELIAGAERAEDRS